MEEPTQPRQARRRTAWIAGVGLFLAGLGVGVVLQTNVDVGGKAADLFTSEQEVDRQRLRDVLGLDPGASPGWESARVVSERDKGSYREVLIEFSARGEQLRAYLLVPALEGRLPAVLALHGHGTKIEDVVGVAPSPVGVDFGPTLAKAGFVVLAPEVRLAQDQKTEDLKALELIMQGRSLLGERLRDLRRCLSFLATHDRVQPERVGVLGWSLGGGLALYLCALEPGIAACYVSCYFGSYWKTVLALRQTTDNYVPRILEFGDLPDVAALVAPRPLFVEHPSADREFPAEQARDAFARVSAAYEARGAKSKAEMTVAPGGHRFHGPNLVPWFQQALAAGSR